MDRIHIVTFFMISKSRYSGRLKMNLKALIFGRFGIVITILLLLSATLHSYQRTYFQQLTKVSVKHQKIADTHTSDHQNIGRQELMEYVEKVKTAHEKDSSGDYMIVPNISVPIASLRTNETISLITHTTSSNLHYLNYLTETWHKPVSVTVFTHGNQTVFALYAIAYLHTCFKNVRSSVSFHIAYPILYPPVQLNKILYMEINCDDFLSLQREDTSANYDHNIPYPLNVLRNVAIKNVLTPYILMVDIDLMLSNDLAEQFTQFIRRNNLPGSRELNDTKIAYVVPTFESKSNNTIPDKQALIKEWYSRNVRKFYHKMCWSCQKPTAGGKWIDVPYAAFMDVAYYVEWKPIWEPFYIAKKQNLPLYDERFKQYGYDRISQSCELHVAGYQFAVLNNAFLVHKGFKEPGEFHQRRNIENKKNAILYGVFKKELKKRYPNSNRNG